MQFDLRILRYLYTNKSLITESYSNIDLFFCDFNTKQDKEERGRANCKAYDKTYYGPALLY